MRGKLWPCLTLGSQAEVLGVSLAFGNTFAGSRDEGKGNEARKEEGPIRRIR